ncbi:hypothetical protein BD626DRAFT_573573 [Schizophyllum amplum]|uniref:Uncharacterized protein n=1 Tax=Schizophyllum amplum TaxID=97359 RepID=A0A550C0P2_9AGAR|nr:hypothetical protein BD626DRAFT_573573 [Auriculariopsis ampla]
MGHLRRAPGVLVVLPSASSATGSLSRVIRGVSLSLSTPSPVSSRSTPPPVSPLLALERLLACSPPPATRWVSSVCSSCLAPARSRASRRPTERHPRRTTRWAILGVLLSIAIHERLLLRRSDGRHPRPATRWVSSACSTSAYSSASRAPPRLARSSLPASLEHLRLLSPPIHSPLALERLRRAPPPGVLLQRHPRAPPPGVLLPRWAPTERLLGGLLGPLLLAMLLLPSTSACCSCSSRARHGPTPSMPRPGPLDPPPTPLLAIHEPACPAPDPLAPSRPNRSLSVLSVLHRLSLEHLISSDSPTGSSSTSPTGSSSTSSMGSLSTYLLDGLFERFLDGLFERFLDGLCEHLPPRRARRAPPR